MDSVVKPTPKFNYTSTLQNDGKVVYQTSDNETYAVYKNQVDKFEKLLDNYADAKEKHKQYKTENPIASKVRVFAQGMSVLCGIVGGFLLQSWINKDGAVTNIEDAFVGIGIGAAAGFGLYNILEPKTKKNCKNAQKALEQFKVKN